MDMKESSAIVRFLILGFFVFVLIFLKVIFYKSNIKHNSPGSAALLIIEMMPTIFKTKVNPQGAVKWFHRK